MKSVFQLIKSILVQRAAKRVGLIAIQNSSNNTFSLFDVADLSVVAEGWSAGDVLGLSKVCHPLPNGSVVI